MLIIFFVALLGLVVGSFLNVCIHRLPRGQSVVHPRSRCPQCGHQLSWYENIPVLSYLALGGRCRMCHTRISLQYPLIELLTAVIFVGTYELVGLGPLLIPRLFFGSVLIVLMLIDLEHRILPNVVTLPALIAGLLFSAWGMPPGWLDSLIGALAGGGLLLAIGKIYALVRHEEGIGLGDVKMLAMIGAFLGWKLMLVTLVLSSFAGALVGVLLILLRRGDMKYALPFGTFLALGALAASVFGDRLLAWYLGFY